MPIDHFDDPAYRCGSSGRSARYSRTVAARLAPTAWYPIAVLFGEFQIVSKHKLTVSAFPFMLTQLALICRQSG
jgi:hypothetical protein